MSREFEEALITEFSKAKPQDFRVNLKEHKIFLCGGPVDAAQPAPPSFRDRLVAYLECRRRDISKSIILAESFKDYFKENAYSDLLVFEDDIGSICSLVVIFLESPGSLVELGMFCSKPNFFRKLLIVAPNEEIQAEDSFIFLGPLGRL
ncbi:retron St85 family effector protein [Hahella ganghwensis]|uniref:retron St85 family effector protein n=1 Tax=Hahella ganghwensis TaxID=286420 RepID=UPI0003785105|nr:retron St85 family effector protein [Hahella ganghwensis]